MTEIMLTDGRTVEKQHVYVKANGWVKSYDNVEGQRGNRDYENLTHYPSHMVQNINGDVTYESPHGRV